MAAAARPWYDIDLAATPPASHGAGGVLVAPHEVCMFAGASRVAFMQALTGCSRGRRRDTRGVRAYCTVTCTDRSAFIALQKLLFRVCSAVSHCSVQCAERCRWRMDAYCHCCVWILLVAERLPGCNGDEIKEGGRRVEMWRAEIAGC